MFHNETDDGWDEVSLERAVDHAGLVEIGSRRCINDVRSLRSTVVALYREMKRLVPSVSRTGESTKFEQAMQEYTGRAQFHDAARLDAVIQAAREEERAKFPELTAAAKRVLEEDRQWMAARFRGM